MREIKFKVWDTVQKCYLDYYQWNVWHHPESTLHAAFENKRFVFQQYTGVKDKNGKEVYEGDIVEYYNPEDWMYQKASRKEVKWGIYSDDEYVSNLECWTTGKLPISEWRNGGVQYGRGHEICLKRGLVIVGNIFENPELLQ